MPVILVLVLALLLGACARRGTGEVTTPAGRSASTQAAPLANPHARERIGTVREMYNGTLSPELAVSTFRNIDRLFPTRTVAHGPSVLPLPVTRSSSLPSLTFTSAGTRYTLDDYVRLNRVAALLVLKNGHVVLERYEFGNSPRTRWMSMSVAKSITSTLIGAAIRDGKIRNIDDAVTSYVPRLAGSAYDGVTVRQLLMMASGV